jgi:hypothetical protein
MDDENDVGTANEQPADLRSVLSQALEEQRAPDTGATSEQSSGAADDSAAPAESRARDASGRFARKTEGEEGAADTDAASAETKPASETQPKTEGETAAEAAATGGAEAPVHWSAADKERLNALPAEARPLVLDFTRRMEAAFTPKLQRLASYERDYQGVPELFAPHAEAMRQAGTNPGRVIQTWAAIEQGLLGAKTAAERGQRDENGAAIVARMIENYRIDPAHVAEVLVAMKNGQRPPSNGHQNGAQYRDPRVDDLSRQLNELSDAEKRRQEEAENARIAATQRQIDTFANEKDAQGNLKHPFFADLHQDMTALAAADAQLGKSINLADLYERAVYANRETRTKLLSADKEVEAKRLASERRAKAEAAQRASSSVTGSAGAGQSPSERRPGSGSVRDALVAAVKEHSDAA